MLHAPFLWICSILLYCDIARKSKEKGVIQINIWSNSIFWPFFGFAFYMENLHNVIMQKNSVQRLTNSVLGRHYERRL